MVWSVVLVAAVVVVDDDVVAVAASAASCPSIACRSAENTAMKSDTLLAATEPVLVMLSLEVFPDVVVAFEAAEVWLRDCHQFEEPLIASIDMSACSSCLASLHALLVPLPNCG